MANRPLNLIAVSLSSKVGIPAEDLIDEAIRELDGKRWVEESDFRSSPDVRVMFDHEEFEAVEDPVGSLGLVEEEA